VGGDWGRLGFWVVGDWPEKAAGSAGEEGEWDFDEEGEERWGFCHGGAAV